MSPQLAPGCPGSCVSSARCAREVCGRQQSHKWLIQCLLDPVGILVDHIKVLASLNSIAKLIFKH